MYIGNTYFTIIFTNGYTNKSIQGHFIKWKNLKGFNRTSTILLLERKREINCLGWEYYFQRRFSWEGGGTLPQKCYNFYNLEPKRYLKLRHTHKQTSCYFFIKFFCCFSKNHLATLQLARYIIDLNFHEVCFYVCSFHGILTLSKFLKIQGFMKKKLCFVFLFQKC